MASLSAEPRSIQNNKLLRGVGDHETYCLVFARNTGNQTKKPYAFRCCKSGSRQLGAPPVTSGTIKICKRVSSFTCWEPVCILIFYTEKQRAILTTSKLSKLGRNY